jgi:hypothetical protein
VQLGIAKKLQPAELCDFLGDFNLMGNDQERQFKEFIPDPSMAQLRQVTQPLGSVIN